MENNKIIYQDEYIEIRKSEIDHCIEYIRKKTTNNADADKEMLNNLNSQIKENIYNKVICDVSRLDFIRAGTRSYLRNFCFPFLGYVGARVFAVVTGSDSVKKLRYQKVANEFSEIINAWNMQYDFFYTIDDAKKWIINK
jgi:hypothetical protein